MMALLQIADQKHSGSSAMAGPMEPQQALASIVLWNSGHFDTLEIANLINVQEDAVYRTLHAARAISKGGAA
jgi:hypothetical protein